MVINSAYLFLLLFLLPLLLLLLLSGHLACIYRLALVLHRPRARHRIASVAHHLLLAYPAQSLTHSLSAHGTEFVPVVPVVPLHRSQALDTTAIYITLPYERAAAITGPCASPLSCRPPCSSSACRGPRTPTVVHTAAVLTSRNTCFWISSSSRRSPMHICFPYDCTSPQKA